MLSGAANPVTYSWNNRLITPSAGKALELTPALEEGVQEAEVIVATAVGFSLNSNFFWVCAVTNQRNIANTQPTLVCSVTTQGSFYRDPVPARQPGGPDIPVGFGTTQVYYADRIYWAEVRP